MTSMPRGAGGITPAMLAKLESLLGDRPDKDSRAIRWKDIDSLRASLIGAGGAGTLDGPPQPPEDGSGTLQPVTGGAALIARLRRAEKEIDAAEESATAAMDRARNALSALDNAGTVLRTTNMVTLPDGSRAAGIEGIVWDAEGNGTGSLLMLHGAQVIAPGTLSANEFVAGFGNNLCQNSRFYDGATHWQGSAGAETVFSVRTPGQTFSHPSFSTLLMSQGGPNANATSTITYAPQQDGTTTRLKGAPAAAGKWYGASAHVRTASCDARVIIEFFDAAGGSLLTHQTAWTDCESGPNNDPDSWPRLFVKLLAPAGTRFVATHVQKRGTRAGASSSAMALWKPQIEETTAVSVQPAAYSSGEVGLFTGDMMFSRSIFGRHLTVSEAVITASIQIANATIRTAHIDDGQITNAKIGNTIQSDGFVPGENGTGWRILKSGAAEFNNVTIRRQLEVASGTVNIGDFTPITPNIIPLPGGGTGRGAGPEVTLWNGPGLIRTIYTTPVAMTNWMGARRTYLATASMTGTVSKDANMPGANVYFGWTAEVMPLTRFDGGDPTLRILLKFWCVNVSSVSDCMVTWKIYEVS